MSNLTTVEIFDKLLSIDQNLIKSIGLLTDQIAIIKLVLCVFAFCITLVMILTLSNYRKIQDLQGETDE